MGGSTSLLTIQIAVIDKLLANVTFNALVGGRLYDEVPTTESFPYVVMGDYVETRFNTFDRFGRDLILTVHIWSQYAGYKEGAQIMEIMNTTLDYEPLILADNRTVYIRYEDSQALRDPDGRTRHIAVRYRAITQETIQKLQTTITAGSSTIGAIVTV